MKNKFKECEKKKLRNEKKIIIIQRKNMNI